jgi:hypothetical protein
MIPTSHDIEHITIVIRPVYPEDFDPAREEWVDLDSVEDVEGPIPVVRVLAKVEINRAEYASEGNVAMEG